MKRLVSTPQLLTCGLAVIALLQISAIPASGQAEAGSIQGTVRDASGAVITGATVTTTSIESGAERNTQSSSLGQYSIHGLAVGHYRVTVKSHNFETFEAAVEVTVGGITTVNGQLTVGQSSTVVEVSGATAGTEVNTQTQEMSQLVDTQQLAQLPSLTRNPYDFVAISGNVSNGDNTTNSANSGQELSSRGVGYAINGQRESGTEILLDGVENVAVFSVNVGEDVPIDAVQNTASSPTTSQRSTAALRGE